jgi:cob(I)alamin adenosyltransferase
MKGYIQVYTGDGKGKTTAAIGLALRAAGAGLKIYIAQFVKGMHYSELSSLKKLGKNIKVKQYGRGCFIRKAPTSLDVKSARAGFSEVGKLINSGKYDIVILDEANIAIYYKLFSIDELIKLLKNRPKSVEIVITGRKLHPKLLKIADLVTDMKEVKHYYTKGVQARAGIEK